MRTVLALLLTCIVTVSAYAQSNGASFVVVTAEYKWPDGLTSAAGEVERILAVDGDDYIIWHESGSQYRLPKRFGQIVTAEDAALGLIELRQELYAEIAALNEKPTAKIDNQSASLFGEIIGIFFGSLFLGYFLPFFAPKGPDGKRRKTLGGVIPSTTVLFIGGLAIRFFALH